MDDPSSVAAIRERLLDDALKMLQDFRAYYVGDHRLGGKEHHNAEIRRADRAIHNLKALRQDWARVLEALEEAEKTLSNYKILYSRAVDAIGPMFQSGGRFHNTLCLGDSITEKGPAVLVGLLDAARKGLQEIVDAPGPNGRGEAWPSASQLRAWAFDALKASE